MPYEETGAEKIKRKAYEKANQDRGVSVEKQRNYERFGTTEQNIPSVDPMGNVISGGEIGAPRISKDEMARSMLGMKKGGKVSSASKRADGCAIKGKTKGRMV